jgi:hypothetical protein
LKISLDTNCPIQGGWLSASALAAVATRVVAVMFAQRYGPKQPRGLFRFVEDRYWRRRRKDEFIRAVGEGTLWAALIASLSSIVDAPARRMIPQPSALSQVFGCKELLALATPEHLSSLVQSLVIPSAEFALTDKAAHVQAALEQLVTLLRDKESEIYAQQGSGRCLHTAGALLWSSRWGWSTTPTGQAQSYVSDTSTSNRRRRITRQSRNAWIVCARPCCRSAGSNRADCDAIQHRWRINFRCRCFVGSTSRRCGSGAGTESFSAIRAFMTDRTARRRVLTAGLGRFFNKHMKAVLGVHAAWTLTQPSGLAAAARYGSGWNCARRCKLINGNVLLR